MSRPGSRQAPIMALAAAMLATLPAVTVSSVTAGPRAPRPAPPARAGPAGRRPPLAPAAVRAGAARPPGHRRRRDRGGDRLGRRPAASPAPRPGARPARTSSTRAATAPATAPVTAPEWPASSPPGRVPGSPSGGSPRGQDPAGTGERAAGRRGPRVGAYGQRRRFRPSHPVGRGPRRRRAQPLRRPVRRQPGRAGRGRLCGRAGRARGGRRRQPARQRRPAAPTLPAYDGVLGVGAVGAGGRPRTVLAGRPVRRPGRSGQRRADRRAGAGPPAAEGTSYAAPFVAATAALLRQYRPELTAAEVADRIVATADPAPGRAAQRVRRRRAEPVPGGHRDRRPAPGPAVRPALALPTSGPTRRCSPSRTPGGSPGPGAAGAGGHRRGAGGGGAAGRGAPAGRPPPLAPAGSGLTWRRPTGGIVRARRAGGGRSLEQADVPLLGVEVVGGGVVHRELDVAQHRLEVL